MGRIVGMGAEKKVNKDNVETFKKKITALEKENTELINKVTMLENDNKNLKKEVEEKTKTGEDKKSEDKKE